MIAQLLALVAQFVTFVSGLIIPTSASGITLLHVAIWTPVVIGLVALTGRTVRGFGRRGASASPTPASVAQRRRASQSVVVALADAGRLSQRHIRMTTPLDVGETAAALAELRQRGLLRRRWGGYELTDVGRRAAVAARRAEQTALQREAQRAQRAAEQAQARATKAAEQAQARTTKAAEREAARQARATKAAERAANPPAPRTARRRQPTTEAFGADPNRRYTFRYRLVSLDSLITSNTDTGAINPAYDPTLQPRQRDRAASQRQIEQVARNLVPESYLWDFRQLDKGAPIIGSDSQVESGNGRTLALRRARQDFPEQYARYQEALKERARELGIPARELAAVESPVLVRERITEVDRAAFAREANAPPVLQMSTLETALSDRRRISDPMIARLHVREGQSIDQALRARSNSDFVRGFLGSLSENEAAQLQRRDGSLNQQGIWRIKGALFTRVFEGQAGERLAETFLESLDSTTKNFETAISATLPVLVRAESLVESGARPAELSLADDISRSLDMLARLREDETPVNVYLEQATMFERELTPEQEQLLAHFDDIGRSPKQIREFFTSYAAFIEDAPAAGQESLFGPIEPPTKAEIISRITKKERVTA